MALQSSYKVFKELDDFNMTSFNFFSFFFHKILEHFEGLKSGKQNSTSDLIFSGCQTL